MVNFLCNQIFTDRATRNSIHDWYQLFDHVRIPLSNFGLMVADYSLLPRYYSLRITGFELSQIFTKYRYIINILAGDGQLVDFLTFGYKSLQLEFCIRCSLRSLGHVTLALLHFPYKEALGSCEKYQQKVVNVYRFFWNWLERLYRSTNRMVPSVRHLSSRQLDPLASEFSDIV